MPLSSPEKLLSASKTASVVLRVGLEHHEKGDLREAATYYQEVRGMDPGNAHATFLLGLIALSVNNDTAAEQLLRVAVQRMPRAAHAHRALGDALARRGRAGAALKSYWKALSLDPKNPLSYVSIGQALMAMKPAGGNDELAAGCFARALLLDGTYAAARDGLNRTRLCAQGVHVGQQMASSEEASVPVQ